jgi:hypothetical protein
MARYHLLVLLVQPLAALQLRSIHAEFMGELVD